jgi:hypothetical protein
MSKSPTPPIRILPKDFDRKAEAILARIQPELLPEHAEDVVAINVTTGEYVLAPTARDAGRQFRQRWPNEVAFVVRADGGGVGRLSWLVRKDGVVRSIERCDNQSTHRPKDATMKQSTTARIPIVPKDFGRKAEAILAHIQRELLPIQAEKIVAINVSTKEYTLGDSSKEAMKAFKARWPDEIAYVMRADGGPVNKFHGK